MKKLVAECIGTFALVFAGTGAIVINDVSGGGVTHVGIALTFGLVVLAMIYAVGDISGAHLNPAVTIGFWVSGRFRVQEVLPYIASQSVGVFAASGILKLLFLSHPTLGSTLPAGSAVQSFVLELILTFILMFVILNVSTGAKERRLRRNEPTAIKQRHLIVEPRVSFIDERSPSPCPLPRGEGILLILFDCGCFLCECVYGP